MEEKIKIHCTDKDQYIEAEVLSRSDSWISALLPGPNKLNLQKIKANLYVGNLAGYEFVYKDNE